MKGRRWKVWKSIQKRMSKKFPYSEEEIKQYMMDVRLQITDSEGTLDDQEALKKIENYVFSCPKAETCSHHHNIRLIERLFYSLRKEMDILQPYIEDKSISEIMVNGKDHVFAERNGKLERLPIAFDSTEDLEELIRRIAARVHREINELNPIVDARLSDGSRVNAVYKNIALNGPILTIRKFPEKIMSMEDLVEKETITKEAAAYLKVLVKAGYNCFICGGTSSGKTTMLNVLAQFVPSGERVVVIEDSAELQIRQVENIVRLECRNANVQGKGEVDMAQLVKASLRMRPDRILIGEVRGKEVMDMIQALNTGHSGSLSTGHANSIEGMLKRLEAMFLQAVEVPVDAIRNQITEAIDIMIHVSRMQDGSRKVMEIAELSGLEDGVITTNPLFQYRTEEDGITGSSEGNGKHAAESGKTYDFRISSSAGVYLERRADVMIKDYTKYELTGREKRIFYFAGYGTVFLVVYLFYHSILLSAVSGCLVYFLQPLVERQLAERRMNLLTVQFKDLLYSLSASVAAGRQMGEALVEAEQNLAVMYEAKEPIMKELRYMRINLVENKESDKVLLKDLATRSKNEDINNFVQVYATCRSMGGDLEKIIGHTSEILSDKMAIEREIKVITAQKKTEEQDHFHDATGHAADDECIFIFIY